MLSVDNENSIDEISISDVKIFIDKNKQIYEKENITEDNKNEECAICCQYFNDKKDMVVNLRCGQIAF